jgi:HPt (histidine-containing phosphotransfer) domain-containing protein
VSLRLVNEGLVVPGAAHVSLVPLDQHAPECGCAIFNEARFQDVLELLAPGSMQNHLRALRELFEQMVSAGALPDEVRDGAHKLASQAGMLGFEQLSSCCSQVEYGAGVELLEQRLEALRQAMSAASPTLDRLLAEDAYAGPREADEGRGLSMR